MTGDVPPARLCTMPTCEREATDPGAPGSLCEHHLTALDGDSSNETKGGGAEEPPHDNPTDARDVTDAVYPETLQAREMWVAWILDGHERKRPVAPWVTGHAYPVEWRSDLEADARPEVDFDTAKRWVDFPLADLGLSLPNDALSEELRLGVILPVDRPPRDRRVVLIDWDDVRDLETGEIHPVAAKFIKKYGGYVEISRSGEGLHQFVFGGLRLRDKFIAPIDDEPFVGDDCPQVEIYDGGRHVAMTGEHVDGTDRDLVDGQDCIDAIVTEYATAELDAGHRTYDPATGATPHDAEQDAETAFPVPKPEPAEYSGPGIGALRESKPADRSLAYHAVVEAFCKGYADVLNWRLEGGAAALGQRDDRTAREVIDDLRGKGRDGGSVGYDKKTPGRVEYDHARATRGEFDPASWETLASWGVLPSEFVEETASNQQYTPETCSPPDLAREPFDLTSRWDELAGERYDAYLDGDGPHIFGDHAGAGKTTNAARGAAARDRPHAVLFQQHKKAREFVRDDATPDDYYHLKGGAQARDDACLDADHANESCTAHPAGECPSMCPIYDLGSDHPIRATYEALLAEVGPVKAHQILGDALPGHDEDGSCAWLEQFSEAARTNRVAGVHEYQVLKTVQRTESGGRRDVIIDESPATLGDGRTVEVARLTRLANALDDVAGLSRSDKGLSKTLEELARFTRDVIDALTGGRDDDLGEIDPPAVYGSAREDDVAGHYLERLDLDGEAWQVAERLAQVKLEYNETIVNRMRNDRWEGAPLAVDALLAAGIAADLPEAVRTAIAAPTTLEHCPRCGGALGHANGARCCDGEDSCGWHETTDALLPRDAPRARAEAGLTGAGSDGAGLEYHALPIVEDLPDHPLVLDATATPAKVAAFYGYDEEDVVVSGDEPLQANLHVTQILDGQYHAGTLKNSDKARERTQATIDTVGRVHDRPMFVVKKEFIQLFEFPEHAEVLHYHATRGLNREQCDAVVCIGAPHPRPDDLLRDARLLAMGRDNVRVGGEEHSTRLEDGHLAANPPVYRKLLYEDDDGNGLAVPTRHYTGLMGELFREGREKELTQVIHRIRPLLADETKSAYLLTNVPTETPVDEVCSFSDLADPIRALLPVPDGAVQLLEAVRDVVEGDAPDGFRAETLVDLEDDRVTNNKRGFHRLAHLSGVDVTYQTVARWVNGLDDLGLLDPEGYVSREGERYSVSRATLTSALTIVSSNGGLQVAAKRLLRRKIADSGDGFGWLRWAREAFDLSGDRCAWMHGGDRPPDAPV